MADVLISGGGPVGLALAIELGQRGVGVTVVEKNETPPRIPKGQNLTPRTMEHMRAWGVEAEIRAAKTIPRGVGLGGLTAYGTLLGGHHYDWFNRGSVARFYGAENERLPQYATEAVLRRRARALPSVELLEGWRTEAVTATAAGVALEVGRAGETRTLSGRWLVGCDGSRSRVRQAAGIGETRTDHERLMVLVVFRSPAFFDLVSRFPDKQFYNVLHPDLDGYWMFFGMVEWGRSFFFHAPVPRDSDRESFDFAGLIHRAVGERFPLEIEYAGFWDLRIAIAERYRAGRVFIAGDAAHSHPPYGGYGINTGFEDARNLGWKLAAERAGWAGPGLLDSYEAERRPVFASTAADFIERFIAEDRAFVRAHDPARDRADFEAAWAARAAAGGAAGVASFAPHYAGSALVAGGGGGDGPSAVGIHDFRARPGHHLPPLPAPGAGTTHAALGAGFTLLAAPGAAPGFAEAAEACGIPLCRAEVLTPAAAETYGHAAILVRPDGYVAWAGTHAEDPARLLRQVTGG